jgi:hypothetical protein
MTDDVWVRMPPLPFEYFGTDAVHRFSTATAPHRQGSARMVPVRANGQPAWGEYRRDPATGVLHLTGIEVVAIAGDRICEITRFETTVAPYFGLPRTLDERATRLPLLSRTSTTDISSPGFCATHWQPRAGKGFRGGHDHRHDPARPAHRKPVLYRQSQLGDRPPLDRHIRRGRGELMLTREANAAPPEARGPCGRIAIGAFRSGDGSAAGASSGHHGDRPSRQQRRTKRLGTREVASRSPASSNDGDQRSDGHEHGHEHGDAGGPCQTPGRDRDGECEISSTSPNAIRLCCVCNLHSAMTHLPRDCALPSR